MGRILRKLFSITDKLGWYFVRAIPSYALYKSYLRRNRFVRPATKLSRQLEANGAIKFASLIDADTIIKVKEIIANTPPKKVSKWAIEWSYDAEIDALLSMKLQPVVEIAETVLQAKLVNCLQETNVYQTIPQDDIGSSYVWHHDGHFSRYKIMVLFTEADENSALRIDLGTQRKSRLCVSYECSRYLEHIPKNEFICSGKAGDVFLFDTSALHRAGNPDPSNPRIVSTLCLGDSSAYMV